MSDARNAIRDRRDAFEVKIQFETFVIPSTGNRAYVSFNPTGNPVPTESCDLFPSLKILFSAQICFIHAPLRYIFISYTLFFFFSNIFIPLLFFFNIFIPLLLPPLNTFLIFNVGKYFSSKFQDRQ